MDSKSFICGVISAVACATIAKGIYECGRKRAIHQIYHGVMAVYTADGEPKKEEEVKNT